MLALLQYIHQLNDGVVITIKLFLSFSEFFFPLGEADELLQSLFVDMAVLLELSIGLLKLLPKLKMEIRTKIHTLGKSLSEMEVPEGVTWSTYLLGQN